MLESLQESVKENTRLLNILIGRTTHRDSSYDELVALHISDMDKFEDFELTLEDKVKRKLMVTIYKCIASEISFCKAAEIYIYLLRYPIFADGVPINVRWS